MVALCDLGRVLSKRIFRISLVAMAVVLLATVCSCFSGMVVVDHDLTQLDTVGEIRLAGFPVWFYASAPGYSMMYGWHLDRLLLNTVCWAGFLFVIAGLIAIIFEQMKRLRGEDGR